MERELDGAFDQDPIAWFLHAQAVAAEREPFDATRAALATASRDGEPSVRFVLVKAVDASGFVFFTNYESDKASHISNNPRAALAFHWHTTGVQVRVRGAVERIDAASSDAYFASRPRVSQLGAWASDQSRVIADRASLEAKLHSVEARFDGVSVVPRPSYWGGYRVVPARIELWQDQQGRMHDRWLFTREGEGWRRSRLQP